MSFFPIYFYVALFLIFVLAIAFLALKFLNKYSDKILGGNFIKSKSCKIEHLTYIDQNTKCALLRHRNKKYLLLLSKHNNLLLDVYEESEKAN
jgi:hypothetical protein